MERLLIKVGIYSFIFSFFLFFIFYPRTQTFEDGLGTVMPYSDYFFAISRYSTIVMVIAVAGTFGYVMFDRAEKKAG